MIKQPKEFSTKEEALNYYFNYYKENGYPNYNKEDHLYFSLSMGSEKESEGEKVPFLNKDSIDSAKKELEDLFDIEKWGDSPRKELFKELQTKILAYFDNLYISPSEKEDWYSD